MSSLSGMIFCITGTVSILRREFEALLVEHGGVVKKTVTRDVSHLICSDSKTTKAQKARDNGVTIITEEQVMELVGDHVVDTTKKHVRTESTIEPPQLARKKAKIDKSGGNAVEIIVLDDDVEGKPLLCNVLEGYCFCLTGKLTRPRKEMETILINKGAQIRSSVVAGVTHLICSDVKSSKATKARLLSIPIVTEDWLNDVLGHDIKEETTARAPVVNLCQQQGNEITDGESVQVKGKPYIMKNIGGVYSCNCPAWKFQSNKIDMRTCKHLHEYLSEASEQNRLGSHSINASPTKKTGKTVTLMDGALFSSTYLMLAHSWNAEQHEPQDFLMSEKLDGMRALWTGKQLVSRQGNPIEAPDFFIEGLPVNMALDGELFAGRGEFQRTVSIARRKNGGEQWRDLKYVVFDAPSIVGGFEIRLAEAESAISELEFVEVHPHNPCRDMDHLAEELKRVEEQGGEGLMMRKKNSAYDHGRSRELLKVKTFKDDEAIVHDHQAGKGRHSGRMGAVMCRLRDGTEFKVGTGFSDKERGDPPPVGTVISFRYFEMTKAGVPRFPVYLRVRRDVDESEFE
mmetsp:Transcript_12567/g.20943  ORF Transcript_12567/g.20943 Transcript_12567/m.20943 type:complete len:571 (-) Transcript_12567:71-1783(-)|eukprot:CAMPEP_0119015124 /NCGR_PEP_ID=MMETSP1176-20130426/10571_1 /TAXON_ID=265551 /ORGANISM="Synedropsis recta cf, Strain CCMP1620" /LENGTH=570 /DNA_ID=CAMNT_0006968393 /DNA_START=104 /DNA_END=1816 /DNA_ORIENTATION=+